MSGELTFIDTAQPYHAATGCHVLGHRRYGRRLVRRSGRLPSGYWLRFDFAQVYNYRALSMMCHFSRA